MPGTGQERIQKILANAGYGSRREIESWILKGRIKINGITASLGDRAGLKDRILLDNKAVRLPSVPLQQTRVIAYHKPVGEICSRRDEKGRKTVFERLPAVKHQRWISIGRLDINSSGLILFTNSGTLANKLMHPSTGIEREYAVRVLGRPSPADLDKLKAGIRLEDGIAAFKAIKEQGGEGANLWFHVVIMEGRNREVRRLWKAAGFSVSRLIRIRFGPVVLPRVKPAGTVWDLTPGEIRKLNNLAGLDQPDPRKKISASKTHQR